MAVPAIPDCTAFSCSAVCFVCFSALYTLFVEMFFLLFVFLALQDIPEDVRALLVSLEDQERAQVSWRDMIPFQDVPEEVREGHTPVRGLRKNNAQNTMYVSLSFFC